MTVISTADFLDCVLPEGHHYIGFTDGTLSRSGRPIIKCSVFDTGASGVATARSKGDTDIFFALASFKEAKVYDQRGGYMKSYRQHDNVDKLKALWLDIDFKMYPSQKECVADIKQFLKDIPDPTFVVNSGGGVHLYWVFEDAIPQAQWQPMAQGLAALAKVRGLRADYGVTIDSARVLRLPGTKNQKYDDKPECQVKAMGSFANLERMEELLLPHAAGIARSAGLGFALDPKVVSMFDPAANSDLSDGYSRGRVASLAMIAAECPTVADSLSRGGNGDSYILWKDLLHLAAFCDDGDEYAEKLSEGDPRYDPATMHDFYSQSLKTKLDGTRGPTSCQKFSSTSAKCATCKHLGAIKSPWVLGVTPEKNQHEPSFVRAGSTWIIKTKVDEETGEVEHFESVVLGAALDNWREDETTDVESPFNLVVDVVREKTNDIVVLTAAHVNDPKLLRKEFIKAGVGVRSHEMRGLSDLVMAWVSHLAQQRQRSGPRSFGWSAEQDSFLLGTRLITVDGITPVTNPHFKNTAMFAEKGKPEPWINMAQTILDDASPAFTYILCAGFAAPLMPLFQDTSLALSVFSIDSGAGKSTILKTIQAGWGDPDATMALEDTSNFVTERIGSTPGTPALWDEIRGKDRAQAITQVVFALSEGKTKGRLNANAEMKGQHQLRTMMICCANIPLSDYLTQTMGSSNAAAARFLEIELQPKGRHDNSIASGMADLKGNYGHFAPTYLRTIMQHMDKLRQLELDTLKMLDTHRVWRPEERFWKIGTAKIIMAAGLMNATGIVKVDVAKLRDYALALIESQRVEMESAARNKDELVTQCINFHQSGLLVTDRFKSGPGRGSVQTMRHPKISEVAVHIGVAERKLRIGNEVLRDFAHQAAVAWPSLRQILITKYGGTETRFTLGGGSEFSAVSAVRGWELDIDKLGSEDSISRWMAASEPTGSGTA